MNTAKVRDNSSGTAGAGNPGSGRPGRKANTSDPRLPPIGATITHEFKDGRTVEAVIDARDSIRVVGVGKRGGDVVAPSLSAAAKVAGGGPVDGFVFWRYNGRRLHVAIVPMSADDPTPGTVILRPSVLQFDLGEAGVVEQLRAALPALKAESVEKLAIRSLVVYLRDKGFPDLATSLIEAVQRQAAAAAGREVADDRPPH